MTRKITLIAAAIVLFSLPANAADETVADGMEVSIEYTIALPDKTVLTSNVGQEPITYQHGRKEILPGLENALTGMKVGETKHIELAAANAYGPYDEKAKLKVKRDQVPADVKSGMTLATPDGRTVKVLEVDTEDVVLDLNHPLAGKDLTFDVKVVKIEKASAADDPEKKAAPAAQ